MNCRATGLENISECESADSGVFQITIINCKRNEKYVVLQSKYIIVKMGRLVSPLQIN